MTREPIRFTAVRILFTIAFFAYFAAMTSGSPFCFDDCEAYIVAMGASPGEAYSLIMKGFRPWSTPAFFALFGKYDLRAAQDIVTAQILLFFGSWALLCHMISIRWFKGPAMSTLLYCALLTFGTSQGYYHLNQYLVSDTLAIAAIFIMMSLLLMLDGDAPLNRTFSWRRVAIYAAFCASFAIAIGARDANMMLALAFVFYFLRSGRKGDEAPWLRLLVVAAILVNLMFSLPFARGRHIENDDHILSGFVLPNPEARAWFAARGLPAAAAEEGAKYPQQDFGHAGIDAILRARNAVIDLPGQKQFMQGFDSLYARFALTHPGLFFDITVGNIDLIFLQDLRGRPSATQFTHPTDSIPAIYGRDIRPPLIDGETGVFICLAALALYAALRGRAGLPYAPLLLSALGALNAVAGFHGDLWEPSEMARHAFIGSFLFRLGGVIALLCLVDLAAAALARRTSKTPAVSAQGVLAP